VAGISNGDLADLLATRAESETGFRQKAFKRAARAAFLWPEEASDLLAGARSLEELHSVGPFIGEQLRGWIEHPPARSAARDSLRRLEDFLTVAEARKILARDPTWSGRLRGKYVVEPVCEQETIIIAELDLNAVDREKMTLDVSGHYSRRTFSISSSIQEKVRFEPTGNRFASQVS